METIITLIKTVMHKTEQIKNERVAYIEAWESHTKKLQAVYSNAYEFVSQNKDSLISQYGDGFIVLHGHDVLSSKNSRDSAIIERYLISDRTGLDYYSMNVFEIKPDTSYL